MDPSSVEFARRVRTLFEEASGLSLEDRASFLEKSCGGDERLRREIDALLDRANDADSDCDLIFEKAIRPSLDAVREDPSLLGRLDDPAIPFEAEVDPLSGQTVSHFEIIAPIGKGGMGVIYEARDRDLDRRVALKFLPPGLSADREAKQRLTNEAKAASALDHVNIATVYEIGEVDGGRLFIAMGLYSGESLKERLDRGPLSVADALDVFCQLANGLSKAHSLGLIHRDIKPGNIMITDEGIVKLLDFGVAKLADASMHTQAGQMIGTIAYMSPEQIRGDTVDPRSDIWSMGVVLHEMLTGRRPFAGDRIPAVIHEILDREFSPPVGVDPALIHIMETCLAKDPAARYATVDALLQDVQRFQTGTTPSVPTVRRKHSARLPWRRLVIGGLALVAALVAFFVLRRPDATPAPANLAASGQDEIHSIAVLPFSNPSSEPGMEFFVDGIHDGITTRLTRDSVLELVSRSSALKTRETNQSLLEVAANLDVDALVVGSVQQHDARVRVTAELIDAGTDRLLWAETYDRAIPSGDASVIGSEIAEAIAVAVQEALAPEPDAGDSALPTTNLAALEEYYRGRTAQSLDDPLGRRKALDHYRRAADLDPEFALAHVRMAEILLTQVDRDGLPFKARLETVHPLLETALALDPNLGVAHSALGRLQWLEGGLMEARLSFRRAMELDPDNADAFRRLGDQMIDVFYRADLSRPLFESAIALDPDRYGDRLILGTTLFIRTRWDEADRIAELELGRNPDSPEGHLLSGLLLHHAFNRLPEAMVHYRKAFALDPAGVFLFLSGPTSAADQISILFAELGDSEEASSWADRVMELNPDSLLSTSHSGLMHRVRSGREIDPIDSSGRISAAFRYASADRLIRLYLAEGRSDLALDLCRNEFPRLLDWQSASGYEGILTAVPDPFGKGRGMVGRLDPLKSPDDCQTIRAELKLSDLVRLDSSARSTGESTLYLRVAHPSLQAIAGSLDHTWGLASSKDSTYDDMYAGYNTYSVQSAWQQNAFMQVRDDKRFVDLGDVPLDKDTFYELWYVVDHDRNTFDLYIKGGRQFPVQTLVYGDAGYRLKTSNPLDLFRMNCSALEATDPLYFDDILVDPNGRNLGAPGDDWIVVEDFEDGDCSDWRINLDWAVPMSTPHLAYSVALVLRDTGDPGQADRIVNGIVKLGEAFHRMPKEVLLTVCLAYGYLQDRGKALEWLERMLGVGYCVRGLGDFAEFAFLHDDPAFLAITTEMEARLDEQSARILAMEAAGHFEALPMLTGPGQ